MTSPVGLSYPKSKASVRKDMDSEEHHRVAKVKSMHRVDAFGNLPGVCRKLAKGIGSLSRWRKGVCQKKNETRRKIIGGSQKAYRESGCLLGDSPKESGSSLGMRREIARKKTVGLTARLPEVAEVYG
ncbi:hypothetical protein B296_00056838, partial [Ensete ventricosum]